MGPSEEPSPVPLGPERDPERDPQRDVFDGDAVEDGSWVPGLGGLDDSDELSDDSDVLALELDQLITDYFDAHREGRAPSVDDYVAAHPEHEHALRAVLPGASLLDQMGKRAEDATPGARSGDRLGEYKLLGVLGRGGMGVVYEAVQETLGRPVALKVLPASRVVDRRSRERFMREAQAAASLQHPGIVPVYGVGEADGQVYYAMQRVDGVPLDLLTAVARGESHSVESEVLVQRAVGVVSRLRGESPGGSGSGSTSVFRPGSSASVGSSSAESIHATPEARSMVGKSWIANAVQIAQQIAEALSYAHSRGVLHRDVKPSNVMLDESGRAYVTDFGLCKVEDSSSLTAAGDVVGTLRYVPPERFQGRDDARGDVYGVGMILYELLCGRPAFDQKDRATLVQAVTLHSPPRPRKLNPEIPEDLERIVLTATAKLPEERYASSEALIADLSSFLAGLPIRARAPGKLYLAKLFARRNRGLVLTVLGAAALLLIVGVIYVRNLSHLLAEVEAGRNTAERMFYHAQVHAAVEALDGPKGGQARSLRILDRVKPESRDWLWRSVRARCEVGLLVVDEGSAPIRDMVLNGDESLVGVLREDSLRVQDTKTGELLYEAPLEDGRALAFVPMSEEVVVVEGPLGAGRTVGPMAGDAVSEARARIDQLLQTLGGQGLVALDASGSRIALAWSTGEALIFDADSGKESQFQVPAAEEAHLELIGSDGRAAFAPHGGRVVVLGPVDGEIRQVAGREAGSVHLLEGARDVPYFVTHSGRSWSTRYIDEGESRVTRADRVISDSGTVDLAISPDGQQVIAQMNLGKARIWSKQRGAAKVKVASYLARATALVWPRGGEEIIAGGLSGEWRLLPRPSFDAGIPGVSEIRGHYSDVVGIAFDVAGDYFATGELSGAWSIWSMERHLPKFMCVETTAPIYHMSLSGRAGRPRALAVAGKEVGVWLMPKSDFAPPAYRAVAPLGDVVGLEWLRPGGGSTPTEILAACKDGSLHLIHWRSDGSWDHHAIWQAPSGIAAFEHHRPSGLTVLATDAGLLYQLRVEDDGTLKSRKIHTFDEPVSSVGIGTLGETVAVLTRKEVLHLVELSGVEDRRGSPKPVRWKAAVATHGTQEDGSMAVAIDEASGWVATAGADGAFQLWSLIDGSPGPTLELRFGRYTGIEFPRPDSPPVTVEARGRVTLIETEGVERMRDLAKIEPTDIEMLNDMRLSAKVRLAQIEEFLKGESHDPQALESYSRLARGLEYFSRFYNDVPNERVRIALRGLESLMGQGKAPLPGKPDAGG